MKSQPVVTDNSLFGGGVENHNHETKTATPPREVRPPASVVEESESDAYRIDPPKPKPVKAEAPGLEMSVFRIQQSLCLFPLGFHFKHPSDKLKWLMKERGINSKEEQAKVLAELKRQNDIVTEALK